MALLKIAPGVSRVHASRRVFEQLQQQKVCVPRGVWVGWIDGWVGQEGVLHAAALV